MNGISNALSLLALSFTVACGGLADDGSKSTGNGGTGTNPTGDTADNFGWDEDDGDDNSNNSADTDTDADSDADSDADADSDTDADTELASGSYDIASGDAEPSLVPSEGRVILMLACDGDITGIQVHAINDSVEDGMDFWFEMDDSNEDGPEHDSGEFLMDDAINQTTVLWSEFEASEDDDVSLNGYGWNGGDWTWLAGGDSIMESVCIGVMLHEDGSGKLCLPEDNDLGGGDLYCDPAYNEASLDEQVADAIEAALAEMLDEYYPDDTTDDGGSTSTSTTETHTVCFKNVDSDVDEMVGYWLTDSNADNWFTDSDIDNVSGSEGMLLWWDSSGDSLCATITTDVSDNEVMLNGYVQLDDGTEDYLVFGNGSSDSWADATLDGVDCSIETNGTSYGGDTICGL